MDLRHQAELLNDILHGDRTHRVWLIEAFMAKLVGAPIPEPRDDKKLNNPKGEE